MQKQAMQLLALQAAMDIRRAMDGERAQQIVQLQHQSTDHAALAERHTSELADLRKLGETQIAQMQGLEQKLANLSSRHEELQQGHHAAMGELGFLARRLRVAQWVSVGSMVLAVAALVATVSKVFNVF